MKNSFFMTSTVSIQSHTRKRPTNSRFLNILYILLLQRFEKKKREPIELKQKRNPCASSSMLLLFIGGFFLLCQVIIILC